MNVVPGVSDLAAERRPAEAASAAASPGGAVTDVRSLRPLPANRFAPMRGIDRQRAALRDLRDGARLWRLALALGWLDIKLRYRGSMLGPFWLTLSTAVMVGALGVVWGTLFGVDEKQYLPFLGLSLVLWNSGISGLSIDASYTFTQADSTIRSMRMPYSVHVVRTMARNLIVLAHNVVVPVAVFAIFDVWPGRDAWASIPGLALWLADGVAICMLLGAVSARFRDLPPIIASVLQIAFYVTPVIWKPSQLGHHYRWMDWNPFDSLLEVVRAPLLGTMPSEKIWVLAVFYSLVLCGLAWAAFVRARARLAFWV